MDAHPQESPGKPSILEKPPAQPASKPQEPHHFWSVTFPRYLDYMVIILAFGLIAFISYDTYKGVDYLMNPLYMHYQFAVCIFFIAEYFYRLIVAKHKIRYLFLALPFLLISIPYLNIVEYFGINVSENALHYLCSIPLFRGLVAQVMVVNYITKNLSTTVLASYVLFLLPTVYMSGLFFYVAEKDVNSAVHNLWYALWWAGMTVTTIGCDINPITPTGMILGFLLSLLGIVMLPLFTVYFGQAVQHYNKKVKEDDHF